MREQLTGKISLWNLLAFSVVLIAAVFMLTGGSGKQEYKGFQVGVGNDSWKKPVYVNITDKVQPSKIGVGSGQTIVWKNRNSFPVSLRIRGVKQVYKIPANETMIFRPSSGFNYVIRYGKERIGKGEISVQR